MKSQTILDSDLRTQEFAPGYGAQTEHFLAVAAAYAETEEAIAVLSNLEAHESHIFWGALAERLGIAVRGTATTVPTIWEDEIFCRIHPDDLERKHIEELRFFHFAQKLPPIERSRWCMHSVLRMADGGGAYVPVCHRIRYVGCEAEEVIRHALCLYNSCPRMDAEPQLINAVTGEKMMLTGVDSTGIISAREKEVLALIAGGLRSKEIADRLGISVYTVSRHRQNLLEKLQAANSTDACRIARRLGMI